MSKQVSLHIKFRQLDRRGYRDFDRTWKPQGIEPNQILQIPLDARGREFIRIKLTEGTDMVTENPTAPQGDLEPLKELKQQADTIKDNLYEKSGIEPSSSLHTKLQTILSSSFIRINGEKYFLFSEPEYSDPVIAQILQAFESEGWFNFAAKIKELNPSGQVKFRQDGAGLVEALMTGQEFYDRFKAELKRQGAPTLEPRMAYPEEIEANVLEAARRAAGVSERAY